MSLALLPFALRIVVDGSPASVDLGPVVTVGGLALLGAFVALAWMVLHYLTRARIAGSLSGDEERMLEDLWRSARTMERRVETLEQLIDADAPASPLLRADFRKGQVN